MVRVAVITPYFNTPDDWLRQCHDSVMAQTYPCTHFMVADGRAQSVVEEMKVQHTVLPHNYADYGDTPRGIGSVLAISQGFDAIAYLDADNWYYPNHISHMVALYNQSRADVISSARMLHRLDGSVLGPCPEVDGEKFVDTSCYFLTRGAFSVVPVFWEMEPHLHAIDDRVIWAHVKHRQLTRQHSARETVAYRTAFIDHYRLFNEAPPPGAKTSEHINKVLLRVRDEQKNRNSS